MSGFTCPVCKTTDDNCAQLIAGVQYCEPCAEDLRRRDKIFTCANCEKHRWTRDAYWCVDQKVCDERCACDLNDAIADARDYTRLMEESKRW